VKHRPGRSLTLARQHLTVDLVTLGPGFLLASGVAWWAVHQLSSNASAFWSIFAAAITPLIMLGMIASAEIIRAKYSGTDHLRRRIGPLGSVETGYTDNTNPGEEFKRELLVCTAFLLAGMLTLAPVLVSGVPDSLEPTLIPGVIVMSAAAISIVPAIPMPGGYILRAIFWFLFSNRTHGMRAAFFYGQLVATTSIGFGIVFLIWRPALFVPAVALLFVGGIVIRASQHELRRAMIVERAALIRAADALSGLNPTIRAAASLEEAIDILMEQRMNGPALVRDRNRYIGMLDILTARQVPRRHWATTEARSVVIEFETLVDSTPGIDLLTILQQLDTGEADAVIVREMNGQIVGIVDRTMDARRLVRRGLARTIAGTVPAQPASEDRETS
jgi:CBS domain-containing protein